MSKLMKRPVHKRKLRKMHITATTAYGKITVPMHKGMHNWRALAGQRVNKLVGYA